MTERAAEVIHIRLAKPNAGDYDSLFEIHHAIEALDDELSLFSYEEIIEDDIEDNLSELLPLLNAINKANSTCSLTRVILTASSLVESACDPELDFLEFKPVIEQALKAYQDNKAAQS